MGKALFIVSRPIFPIVGGDQIRAQQQLEFLSRKYLVDVIFLSSGSGCVKSDYLPYAHDVKCFYRSKIKCLLGALRFLTNKLPIQVNYYRDKMLQRYVNQVADQYDVIFCNNIRTTEFARKCSGIKRIVDFVDAISMNYDKARKHSIGLKKLIYTIDFYRCKSYEKKILQEFDVCMVISSADKQFIES